MLSLTLYPALFSASPSEEDDAVNADMTSHARHCIVRRIQSVSDEEVSETAPYLRNPLLNNLRSIAATDTACDELIQTVSNGFPSEHRHYPPTSGNMGHRSSAWIFQLTRDWMDELYNGRIVVPKAA
jgi:hypothetical protein